MYSWNQKEKKKQFKPSSLGERTSEQRVFVKMIIKKNEKYSKLLAEEGSQIPCDIDSNFEIKLPAWINHNVVKLGQLFFFLNMNGMIRGILLGLLQITSEQTIFQILDFTKNSAVPTAAYKRYRATFLHGKIWGQNDLKPGTKAWESLKLVRKIHVSISQRAEKKELGIISQKDMAITQFAFVGMQLLQPGKIGIFGSREQLERFSHYWRVLGSLLGIEDRFNACGETLDETLARLEAIREDFIVPSLTNIDPTIENYLKIAVEGMSGFEPWLEPEAQVFMTKRLVGVEGYNFFKSEGSLDIYNKLSSYSRFRVATDIVIYEYLSKVWPFRWCFNICRLCFDAFNNYFPIFAIMKFGKKNAKVEVLKNKSE